MSERESIAFHEVLGHRIAAVTHEPDQPSGRVVVMAHGFRSSKIGPSRYFVPLARALVVRGIAAFRFDQPGSGDSSGDFDDSSFATWIDTIEHFARQSIEAGNDVALLGQSVGRHRDACRSRSFRRRDPRRRAVESGADAELRRQPHR